RVWNSAGLVLLACALGCGGKVGSESSGPEASYAPPRYNPSRPPPANPTAPPRGRGGAPAPATTQPATMPVPAMQPPAMQPAPDPDVSYSTARDAAENVLAANCGSCHGPNAPVEGS